MPLERPLFKGSKRGRLNIKLRLVASGLKAGMCECCGIADERGRPLSLALQEINGDRHDNRLVNLQLLYTNCPSETPNFARRNR